MMPVKGDQVDIVESVQVDSKADINASHTILDHFRKLER